MTAWPETYLEALRRHLQEPDEVSRLQGYDLGRLAMAEGKSLLNVVDAHRQALESLSLCPASGGLDFLEETISPFEMALRGYREANQDLREANAELAEINAQLKDTQTQLVHAAKMASLGTLTAGIAHEVNNPLAFCLSHVESIQRWLARLQGNPASGEGDPLWAKVESRLSNVLMGLERIRDLVAGLRTFSRLDEGEFRTVDIHECIESSLLFLSHETRHRIEIVREYTENGLLECYPGLLSQIAMNLLANAVQAIPDQGTITVTTSRRPGRLSLSITDTGVGIPEEVKDRIFEPFFTTRPVGAGTGLGLAITYKLVEAHQGCISVESSLGKGSCFHLDFPLSLEKSPAER